MIETNHKKIANNLKKKGWDKQTISHSVKILKNAHKTKPKHFKKLDDLFYFLFLFLIILANVLIFIGVLPVLIMLPGWFSGIILGILGLCVGVFIDIIIRHHDLKHKHYFFAIFFVTLLAVFSIVSIFTIVKPIIATKNLYITLM